MTIPKVKCEQCGHGGEFNSETYGGLCQDCGEYKKCPKCKNQTICRIGSSTLPIIGDRWIYGGKVPEPILKKHNSIKAICGTCLYEW